MVDAGAGWWPEAVSAGEITYPPGGTYGPRTQVDYQLVALHSGWLSLDLDGATYRFDAGTVFLLRPGHREHFRFAADAPTRHTWVAARVPSLPEDVFGALGPAPPGIALSAELEQLIRVAVRLRPYGGGRGGDLASTVARAALLYFRREAGLGRRVRGRPPHEAVLRARVFVRQHVAEPLTLTDIARAAAVSGEHLCRLFRAERGTTPMAFLWAERTQEGMRLLAATGLAVKEIVDRCGFRTTFHFARRIREATGLSPTAYRAAHWHPGYTGDGG